MNRSLNIILIMFLILSLYSCEEVIDINLNESDPNLVIEAVIYRNSPASVRISQTTNYFSSEGPAYIDDAIITISTDGSIPDVLSNYGTGYYEGNSIYGIEGTKYEIEVRYDGKIYQASSTMQTRPEIVSLNAERIYSRENEEDIYTINCLFTDDPDLTEFYLLTYRQNDEKVEGYYHVVPDFIANDGFIVYNSRLFTFIQNDDVEVHVYSIDETVYEYFSQLNEAISGINMFSTPYNPKSNFDNDALGFFAALTYDTKGIVVE